MMSSAPQLPKARRMTVGTGTIRTPVLFLAGAPPIMSSLLPLSVKPSRLTLPGSESQTSNIYTRRVLCVVYGRAKTLVHPNPGEGGSVRMQVCVHTLQPQHAERRIDPHFAVGPSWWLPEDRVCTHGHAWLMRHALGMP